MSEWTDWDHCSVTDELLSELIVSHHGVPPTRCKKKNLLRLYSDLWIGYSVLLI